MRRPVPGSDEGAAQRVGRSPAVTDRPGPSAGLSSRSPPCSRSGETATDQAGRAGRGRHPESPANQHEQAPPRQAFTTLPRRSMETSAAQRKRGRILRTPLVRRGLIAVSTRGERAVKALRRFGELAWFSLPLETNPTFGYPQVPYLGWRYASPDEEVARFIDATVTALPTQIEWTLDRSRRNWLLVPTRIPDEAQGVASPAFKDVIQFINTQDQDFCLKAQSDFELIIQRLQEIPIPEH